MTTNKRISEYQQWIPWRLAPRPNSERMAKVPVDVRTGKAGDIAEPGIMQPFAVAQDYAKRHGCAGIGFVLTHDDPFVCIDLDNCIDNGHLSDLATELVRKANTFTEITHSGKGLHLWLRSPELFHCSTAGIEIYSEKRFIAMTFRRWADTPNVIANDTGVLADLVATYAPPVAQVQTVRKDSVVTADDNKLWQVIFKYDRTGRLERLFNGDISFVGNDHSRGEIILLNCLSKYTSGDHDRIKRMALQTGLTCDKWAIKGYLDRQIQKSIAWTLGR